jgi:hypothetical protein
MGIPLVALLALLSFAAPAPASPAVPGPDPAYLDELLLRARQKRLWEDPGWLRLGHYRPRMGGYESEVDGLVFFRALRGKTDPRAELFATLRAFFDGRPVADELSDAQCRYPARLAFLSEKLGIEEARLPRRACPRFQAFLDRIRVRSVTMVFSSYYLNNPASAFGHTFLRLNKEEGGAREGRAQELLDYGVDYSATVDTENAVAYALKGLFGAFPGNFRSLAYYYKVREYADAESRDLWEYDLALEPGEVSLLAGHLWELGGTYFDYWYVDENCSYQILGLLEAAAPRIALLDHVGRAVVIPADTVKALFANPGLVRAVHWRPSIRTQFEARIAGLSGPERDAVEGLASDPRARLPSGLGPERQAAVLDAALDHLDLRFGRDLAFGKAPDALRTRQTLLERRSALGVVSPPLDLPPPSGRAPQLGHGSSRWGLGGGYSSSDGPLVVLDLRLGLHDLGDPPEGYPPLAQLEFFPTRLLVATRTSRVLLDEGWFVRIVSLTDVSRFELKPSWRARLGAATVWDSGCNECLAGEGELGGGLTKTLGPLDLYAGVDVSLEGAPALSGIDGKPIRLGLGPGGLARLRLGKLAILLADARWSYLPAATPRETFDLRGTLRIPLGKSLALSLEARRTPSADEGSLVLHAFY